jgi:hypothetical protein
MAGTSPAMTLKSLPHSLVMRGLDPRIHDEIPTTQAVLIFAAAIHRGLPGQARQ